MLRRKCHRRQRPVVELDYSNGVPIMYLAPDTSPEQVDAWLKAFRDYEKPETEHLGTAVLELTADTSALDAALDGLADRLAAAARGLRGIRS